MNKDISFVLLALLLTCTAAQNVVILNSSPSTTTVVSPAGQAIGLEPFHNAANPNYLGTGAQWVWVNGPSSWPDQYAATFQALFYSDCPEVLANLQITADNVFTAYLNGVKVGEGNDWKIKFSFKLGLKCGLNNLTIAAINKDDGSPASLIFSINQEQKACYACRENPSGIYNRKTCRCECSTQCPCSPKIQEWIDYPFCGCKCLRQLFVSCNPETSFWSDKSCSCECKQKWCPAGQIQDLKSCQCVKCPVQICQPGFAWDAKTCQCARTCLFEQLCVKNKFWSPTQCACICPNGIGLCPRG